MFPQNRELEPDTRATERQNIIPIIVMITCVSLLFIFLGTHSRQAPGYAYTSAFKPFLLFNQYFSSEHGRATSIATNEPISTPGEPYRVCNRQKAEHWNDTLTSRLPGKDWEVQSVDEYCNSEGFYSSQIFNGYQLEHEPRSNFIVQHSTDTLVALCKDGSVYSFAIDFEWGCLISDTIDGAMRYISNPGQRAKGPARWCGHPYDANAEDVFGDKFGDEVEYDSGIEDCGSEGSQSDCE